ncbi:MAG: hypothetical protein AB8B87_04740 [Granulosicoccus sp.]
MRLIFLLQKKAWFIEHEQAWYRLNDMKAVSLGLSGLALNTVNQHDLIEQPHQAGTATISQPDSASLKVRLSSPDNETIHDGLVKLDHNVLLNVNWKTKQFRDGWMCSDATVTLDNVGEMYMDAYLPARSNSDGKTLRISNSVTGKTEEVWIARDKKTRVPVLLEGCTGKVSLKLTCKPEVVDQSTDPRQLGFVLVSEDVRPI